jgi:hypothetical protein
MLISSDDDGINEPHPDFGSTGGLGSPSMLALLPRTNQFGSLQLLGLQWAQEGNHKSP